MCDRLDIGQGMPSCPTWNTRAGQVFVQMGVYRTWNMGLPVRLPPTLGVVERKTAVNDGPRMIVKVGGKLSRRDECRRDHQSPPIPDGVLACRQTHQDATHKHLPCCRRPNRMLGTSPRTFWNNHAARSGPDQLRHENPADL